MTKLVVSLLTIIFSLQLADRLNKQIKVGDHLVTLGFLIVDYVAHLEHHLKQIIDY